MPSAKLPRHCRIEDYKASPKPDFWSSKYRQDFDAANPQALYTILTLLPTFPSQLLNRIIQLTVDQQNVGTAVLVYTQKWNGKRYGIYEYFLSQERAGLCH